MSDAKLSVTCRQRQVAELVCEGMAVYEIAVQLGIDDLFTVRKHMNSLQKALGIPLDRAVTIEDRTSELRVALNRFGIENLAPRTPPRPTEHLMNAARSYAERQHEASREKRGLKPVEMPADLYRDHPKADLVGRPVMIWTRR